MAPSLYQKGLITYPPPAAWSDWVWPAPIWKGHIPLVTQEYHAPAHYGVDIMYPWLPGDPLAMPYTFTNGGHPQFTVPGDDVPCICVGPGKVFVAGESPRGYNIRIDHGRVGGVPVNTYYQHIQSPARDWKKGDDVNIGTELGKIGGDPSTGYPLYHVHFGLLFFTIASPNFDDHWVNPAPALAAWQRISSSVPATRTSGVRALAKLGVAVGGTWLAGKILTRGLNRRFR